MPTYSLNVDLPKPPVPMTVLLFGYPMSGDWWYHEVTKNWIQCKDTQAGWLSEHYYFNPAPQPPKSVIGFKKGTTFQRHSDRWQYADPAKNLYLSLGADTLYRDQLSKVHPSITSFTTTEDGTSL